MTASFKITCVTHQHIIVVFCEMKKYSLLDSYQHFAETHCLHLITENCSLHFQKPTGTFQITCNSDLCSCIFYIWKVKKVKMSLCLTSPNTIQWRHVMMWRCSLPFLASALDGNEYLASYPSHFILQGKNLWHSLDRRLGEHQSQSWCCRQEKNPAMPGFRPGPSSPNLYRATLAPFSAY
jgi:hypothetical protein